MLKKLIEELSSETSQDSASVTATGNETVSLADNIKIYKTNELIKFLQKEEDLGLNNDDLEIICKQK
jgi:hypothetical protein